MLDEEIKRDLRRLRQKQRRRICIGTRFGRPLFIRDKSLNYASLSEKYPLGVVPKWKSNLLRMFRPTYKNSPYFSDTLTSICKLVVGE